MAPVVTAVAATPAVLRPIKNTPPGANRSIVDVCPSAEFAGTPSKNN
jgi:hypothetical protein